MLTVTITTLQEKEGRSKQHRGINILTWKNPSNKKGKTSWAPTNKTLVHRESLDNTKISQIQLTPSNALQRGVYNGGDLGRPKPPNEGPHSTR
jgi:hypothetical protein